VACVRPGVRRDALLAAVFLAIFGLLTAGLAAGRVLIDLDLAVQEWVVAHRTDAGETVMRILNRFGQGGWLLGICVGLAVLAGLFRWRRLRRPVPAVLPLAYVLAAAVLVVPTVLTVKQLTERGAPSAPLPAEQTVRLMGPLPPGVYDSGYPSGHAVNTVVWYGVLLVLVACLLGRAIPPAVSVPVRVGPPLIVLVTQCYLSFHWLSDSLAGFALGIAIDRLLAILRQLKRPHWSEW
jgi:membrane-associated phospholipid phosphatase